MVPVWDKKRSHRTHGTHGNGGAEVNVSVFSVVSVWGNKKVAQNSRNSRKGWHQVDVFLCFQCVLCEIIK